MGWLLTPNIQSDLPLDGRRRYLRRLRSTRQMVECSIGMLKAKFPCLNQLRLRTPVKCCDTILACIALHTLERITKDNNDLYEHSEMNSGYTEHDFVDADNVLGDIVAQFDAESYD